MFEGDARIALTLLNFDTQVPTSVHVMGISELDDGQNIIIHLKLMPRDLGIDVSVYSHGHETECIIPEPPTTTWIKWAIGHHICEHMLSPETREICESTDSE